MVASGTHNRSDPFVTVAIPCRNESANVYVSHAWARGQSERLAVVRSFYRESPPAERAAPLDRLHVDHLVLPGGPGPSPREWLGDRADFERVARLASPSRA